MTSASITRFPASGRHYRAAPGEPGALPYLRWSALASRTARNDSSLLQFGQLRELASWSPSVYSTSRSRAAPANTQSGCHSSPCWW
ncbi:hypothetical protein G6F40_017164 [Rhizopus arrhizus]|nr:hypothetical protein G6F40_017164 [Rhizopus arrhizus]